MPAEGTPTIIARGHTALAELRTLLVTLPETEGCHVFLGTKRGQTRGERWCRLRFAEGLSRKFRAELVWHLLQLLPPRKELTAFSFDEMTSQHIGVIDKSEFPEISGWFDDVPTPDWPQLYDGNPNFLSRIGFHTTTIAADGRLRILKVFKHRTNTTLLHAGGFAAIFSRGRHEFTEPGGSIFDFSLDADFFEWNGLIFILHLTPFESLTNLRQITITRAQDAIAAVKQVENLEVVGLDEVAMRLQERPALAKKLAAAERQGTIDALRPETLLARIQQKRLPLETTVVGSVTKIIVDTTKPNQVNEFVNLITDVYLQSPVTAKEYKVHVKEPA
jgi:hypothetical protein